MFELKLDPEQVNSYVAKAILDSTLGVNLTAFIDKSIKDALNSYNNPIEKLTREAIMESIRKRLAEPDCQEVLRAKIAQHFSGEFIDRVLQRSAQEAIRMLKD